MKFTLEPHEKVKLYTLLNNAFDLKLIEFDRKWEDSWQTKAREVALVNGIRQAIATAVLCIPEKTSGECSDLERGR